MRLCLLFATLVLAATVSAPAPAASPSYIAAAISDAARPDSDRAQDEHRKPADVMVFTGIKPGDTVVDLMPGSGYYTRILSKIVGPSGKVYALQPEEMDKIAPKGLQSLKSFAGTAAYPNVVVLVQPVTTLAIPAKVDMIWTSQNYHDLHDPFMGKPDMTRLDRALFDALKPGGVLVVLDHAAAPGSGTSRTDDLHRIDPAAVKAEVTGAGFVFAGESDVLRNPADNHTLGIRDASLRGQTDRFILSFRKP
ncbi:class I SAM-dependent methyltransferase [Dyella soli]|uniref:Methyltransferase n=1 Tax=Dyella soli TaxID=522319 RepID=A0A4R0YET0_9GAMM|nr:class I SAM-dependent methyltransferase [Dyella soli]TCI06736.1 methyltransferase [Dyella soli]